MLKPRAVRSTADAQEGRRIAAPQVEHRVDQPPGEIAAQRALEHRAHGVAVVWVLTRSNDVASVVKDARLGMGRFWERQALVVERANAGDQRSFGGGRHFCLGAPLRVGGARLL